MLILIVSLFFISYFILGIFTCIYGVKVDGKQDSLTYIMCVLLWPIMIFYFISKDDQAKIDNLLPFSLIKAFFDKFDNHDSKTN